MDHSGDTAWLPVTTSSTEQTLFIEIVHKGGREEVGLFDAVPLDRISGLLEEIARCMANALEKASPSKASVELGLEFGLQEGKLTALIARGSTKANIKISLEWARGSPEK